MFSGGMPKLSIADKAELANLNNEYGAGELRTKELGNEVEAQRTAAVDAGTAASYAEQDVGTAKNRVDGAEEAVENSDQGIAEIIRNQNVLSDKITASCDFRDFMKKHFEREFMSKTSQAKLEAILENRNAYGEIFRAFYAQCIRDNASILSTGGVSANATLSKPVYFRPWDAPPQDGSLIPAAQTKQLKDEFDAVQKQITEKKADPFYRDKLKNAKVERAEAKRKFDKLDDRKRTARASFDSTQERLLEESKRLNSIVGKMRKIQGKDGGNA